MAAIIENTRYDNRYYMAEGDPEEEAPITPVIKKRTRDYLFLGLVILGGVLIYMTLKPKK